MRNSPLFVLPGVLALALVLVCATAASAYTVRDADNEGRLTDLGDLYLANSDGAPWCPARDPDIHDCPGPDGSERTSRDAFISLIGDMPTNANESDVQFLRVGKATKDECHV